MAGWRSDKRTVQCPCPGDDLLVRVRGHEHLGRGVDNDQQQFTTSNATPRIEIATPGTNNVTAIGANLLGSLNSTGAWPTTVFCLWGVSNSPQTFATTNPVAATGPGTVTIP